MSSPATRKTELVELVEELVLKGATNTQIGGALGVSHQYVSFLRQQLGIDAMPFTSVEHLLRELASTDPILLARINDWKGSNESGQEGAADA